MVPNPLLLIYPKLNITYKTQTLTFSELETAYFSVNKNKAPGYDDISSNVILNCYNEIKYLLFHIFNKSITTGIFPEALKIAQITPIFKTGDESILTNYRPISVLPVFSKILERIMYNRIYNYLTKHQLLYNKQFGFQSNNSTDHAILHLVDDISNAFDRGEFTLGVFIDLSKAFDTVNHDILLQKLQNYGITDLYHSWFTSYLSNRKQFIRYSDKSTLHAKIKCGVPQGFINTRPTIISSLRQRLTKCFSYHNPYYVC